MFWAGTRGFNLTVILAFKSRAILAKYVEPSPANMDGLEFILKNHKQGKTLSMVNIFGLNLLRHQLIANS